MASETVIRKRSHSVYKQRRNLQLLTGLALLTSLLVIMAAVTIFHSFSIEIDMTHRLESVSAGYLLGTDEMGRDLLSCLIYGAGVSLATGLAVVLISAVFGGLMGLLAGFAGGVTDTIIMRVVDVLLAFPGILSAIALASFLKPGPGTLILVLSLTGWVEYARLVRGEVMKHKQSDFIDAARSYNASVPHILFDHLMPLVLPVLLVQASLGIGGVILVESGLNFLGIGLDPLLPTLGRMVDAGRAYIFTHPVLVIAPGFVLFVIIIAFNFIGEGLRKKVSDL